MSSGAFVVIPRPRGAGEGPRVRVKDIFYWENYFFTALLEYNMAVSGKKSSTIIQFSDSSPVHHRAL
jgi:hypothetical protein